MDAEIKWMGGELDTARNLYVSIENHARSGKDKDDSRLRAFGGRLDAAQCASYDRALEAIDFEALRDVSAQLFGMGRDWVLASQPG